MLDRKKRSALKAVRTGDLMTHVMKRMAIRPWLLATLALTAALTQGRAGVIEPTPLLPPPNAVYAVADFCLPAICLTSIGASDFQIVSDTFSNGNEVVDTTAIFSATALQNNSGTPGSVVGTVFATGTADLTYFGRTADSETGTFATQFTAFDFTGAPAYNNGNTFEVEANPNQSSSGTTTITAIAPGGDSGVGESSGSSASFSVSSSMTLYATVNLNGAGFQPGPPRAAVLETVPEPGAAGLALSALIGLAGARLRLRRRI
jgi:hypothetical protein